MNWNDEQPDPLDDLLQKAVWPEPRASNWIGWLESGGARCVGEKCEMQPSLRRRSFRSRRWRGRWDRGRIDNKLLSRTRLTIRQ